MRLLAWLRRAIRGSAIDRGLHPRLRIALERRPTAPLYISLHTAWPPNAGNEVSYVGYRPQEFGIDLQRAEVYQNRQAIVFPPVTGEADLPVAFGVRGATGPIILEGGLSWRELPRPLREGEAWTPTVAPGRLVIQMVEK